MDAIIGGGDCYDCWRGGDRAGMDLLGMVSTCFV